MNDWITVISFTYPHEAYLAKGKLESEGIEVMLKDELTTQAGNAYSTIIGGVKLQVKDPDYESARHILAESGYLKNQNDNTSNKLLINLNKATSKLPFIGKSPFEARLLIITALVLILIILPAILLSLRYS